MIYTHKSFELNAVGNIDLARASSVYSLRHNFCDFDLKMLLAQNSISEVLIVIGKELRNIKID